MFVHANFYWLDFRCAANKTESKIVFYSAIWKCPQFLPCVTGASLLCLLNKVVLQASTVIYFTNKAIPKLAWPFDHHLERGKQQAAFAN